MSLMSVSQALVSKLVDFNFLASLTTKKPKQQQQSEDEVYKYTNQALSLGLFYMEYLDAVHEGDGLRVQRCWRYLLPIFRATGRKNYSLEALYMLYASHFSSPRLSHQILWSRFVNTRGLSGHNIPCDLFLEHLNRLCKDAVTCLRSNQTDKAIVRVSKAVGVLHPVIEQFDTVYSVSVSSGAHHRAKTEKDRNMLIEEISRRAQVFKCVPGRKHNTFPNVKSLLQHKPKKLVKWMGQHIVDLIRNNIATN